MRIRFYHQNDRETIESWHEGHGTFAPIENILPKMGIVVEQEDGPLCAIWLYMDNSSSVCFPEHVVSRPGLSLKDAKEAILRGVDFLRLCASEMGFDWMIVHTLPGISRILKPEGFIIAGKREKITMIAPTRKE